MTVDELRTLLAECPIVASVQASESSPVDDPSTLSKLAIASVQEGVRLLRLEGVDNIRAIKGETGLPTIGLIKRRYEESEVYITPTSSEVRQLLELGCEIVAVDGTHRRRPGDGTLASLVELIHAGGSLAMADCDSFTSAQYALECGADLIGTTLAGYTPDRPRTGGPDIELLRDLVEMTDQPVLAEGRYADPGEARTAMRIGAAGVVIGGALNDPLKQTRAFVGATRPVSGPVGAVDIGGTWLRAGLFDGKWTLLESSRVPLPGGRSERMEWIRGWLNERGVQRVGISTGGTVDPYLGAVTEAKEIIPDHVGTIFSAHLGQIKVNALNDGLATAWGHACHPRFAGLRVATLALGTGVGFGLVDRGKILMGPGGEYPRLNDLPTTVGQSYEDLLGGAALTSHPSREQIMLARLAADAALRTVWELYYPDVVVLCGGVGLSDWLSGENQLEGRSYPQVVRSPFGPDAGLYGAAALALYPPRWS
jgi:putative N-acetylmannosamine-6-phosphate epimerase/predicted NBD/HSP70 family sugar kinase